MSDSNDDSDDSYDEDDYEVENNKENNANDKAFNERMERWKDNEEILLMETNLYNVQRNDSLVNQITQQSQGDDDSVTKSKDDFPSDIVDDNQGSSSVFVGTQSHVFTSNTQNTPEIGNNANTQEEIGNNDNSQEDNVNDFDMSDDEINDDDINEECTNILNITSGHMNKKITTAMKHFDCFLNKFYKNGKKHDEISYKDLTIGLIGCFIQYLCTNAHHRCQPGREKIAWKTADSYSSAVKSFYLTKFRENDIPPPFKKHWYSTLRAKMSASFSTRCQKEGVSKVNPYIGGNINDRYAISMSCAWTGEVDMAEFLFLNTSLYHLAGRCTEISSLKKKNVSCVPKSEICCDYEVSEYF